MKLAAICDEVLRQARSAGIQLGKVQVVDCVHTVADVDTDADREQREQGKELRDPEAQVVRKGKQRQTTADGQRQEVQVKCLGYKSHTSMNGETGLITSLVPTGGRAADNEMFPAF